MTPQEILKMFDAVKTPEEYVALSKKFGPSGPLKKYLSDHDIDEDKVESHLARSRADVAAHAEFLRYGRVTTVRCPKCDQIIEITALKGGEHRVKCGCDNFDFTY